MVSVLLLDVFTSLTSDLTGAALDLLAGIFPVGINSDMDAASIYIGLILLIHAIISSYIVKDVDGGNKLAMFQDMVIMLWIGALLEVAIISMAGSIFV